MTCRPDDTAFSDDDLSDDEKCAHGVSYVYYCSDCALDAEDGEEADDFEDEEDDGIEGLDDADPKLACARHGCGHRADRHADMRTPRGQELFWGRCKADDCACVEFAYEPTCDPTRPISVVTAKSGVRYERCSCGIVNEIRPDEATTS